MADRINFAFSERHCKRSFDNHRKNAVRIQLHCMKRRAVGNHGTPFVCQICAMGKIYFEEYQNIRKRGKGGRTAIVVRRDICGKEHAMGKFRRDAGCRTYVRTAMRSNESSSDVKGGKYPIARRAGNSFRRQSEKTHSGVCRNLSPCRRGGQSCKPPPRKKDAASLGQAVKPLEKYKQLQPCLKRTPSLGQAVKGPSETRNTDHTAVRNSV